MCTKECGVYLPSDEIMNTFYELSELEQSLSSMESFDAIANCLYKDDKGNPITLHPLQCIDVMKMLARRKSILIYDTGCGKTYVAAAIMRLLKNEDSSRKFIIFVKKDQLTQTPRKLELATGLSVIASSADARELNKLFASKFEQYDILMLTHDCLHSERMMKKIYDLKDIYCALFIDEGHELNNFGKADSAHLLSAVAKNFDYCYALTATPITTALEQLVRLAAIIDHEHFGNITKLRRAICKDPEVIQELSTSFIVRGGEDFGGRRDYRGRVHWVEPMGYQLKHKSDDEQNLFMKFKGEGAFKQLEALISEIKGYAGKRGLVYINQHKIREWVLPYLLQYGIRVQCINGNTKAVERQQIMHEFNCTNNIDVVITSVTTAVDLDCDYVIFYEFTTNVKQMIGRAHRGLGDKILDIIYIITEDSEEIDFFLNNIWARCELTRDVLKQSCAGLDNIRADVGDKYA